jgi:hypothetical protein
MVCVFIAVYRFLFLGAVEVPFFGKSQQNPALRTTSTSVAASSCGIAP